MGNRIIWNCIAGFALLFAAVHCYAERAPNEYASWKDCKVGTSVKLESKDSAHPEKVEYQVAKLVKINGDELSIEETIGEGKPSVHRISPPKKPSATQAAAAKATTRPDEEGEGMIEIAGQKVPAHWKKEKPYGDTTTTIWTSDEVPSGFCLIKEESGTGSDRRVRTWKVVEIIRP